MVKNIFIGLLLLATIFLIIYAKIQTGFAIENLKRSEQAQAEAEQNMEEARIQIEIAQEAVAELRRVQRQLDDCNQAN